MDPLRSIRILVLAQVVLPVVGIPLGIALEGTLPAPLKAWLDADSERPLTAVDIGLLVTGAILLALFVVSWIHLWNARSQARLLYTSATAGGLLLSALIGPYVMTGVDLAIDSLLGITSGLILGILYFSDLSGSFGAPRRHGAPPPDDDLIG